MTIYTFRANIPANTLPVAPLQLSINGMDKNLLAVTLGSSNADIFKCGFKMVSGSTNIFPASGGQDIEAGGTIPAGGYGWSVIPPNPTRIEFNDTRLDGPPWVLTINLYNNTASAVNVYGIIETGEPAFDLTATRIFAILENNNALRVDHPEEHRD